MYLENWSEAIGVFKGIKSGDFSVSVLFNGFEIPFYENSVEGKIIKEKLNDKLIGRTIALLKTDIPDKPLLVKEHVHVNDEEEKNEGNVQ